MAEKTGTAGAAGRASAADKHDVAHAVGLAGR